jgi:xylan 1,4-beta-xylosidase
MKLVSPLKKPWTNCVGSDRVSTMLRTEYWERFRAVQAVMGFRYIRCHGLLHDELGVVRLDQWEGKERVFYNFTLLDQIFDTMLAHDVKPFVEWGFMPAALASGDQTVFWWKGNVTPPSDPSRWADLVRTLTRHWIERYGLAEVRSWLFEVWNEPNLTVFWKDADQAAYFSLYETTVLAVRQADAELKVGGPAICGGSDHWIEEFLGFVKQRQLPLDFFSRHLYAAQSPVKVTPDVYYQFLASPTTPVDELREVRRRIDAAGFSHLPLHITEFNTSYHPLCPVHDTPLNAAFLARLLSEAGEFAETLSYWTFSDLFEEADVPRSFFHGGFGLLAREGIPKPTFHLFAFFQHLLPEVLSRTDHALVTANGQKAAVLLWNPILDNEAGRLAQTVSLAWPHGRALVRRQRVHEQAGNPWAVWNQLGRPRSPDRDTVEFLRLAAVPQVEVSVHEPVHGGLTLELTLEKDEITLLEVLPLRDETPTYWGLDDRLVGYHQEEKR